MIYSLIYAICKTVFYSKYLRILQVSYCFWVPVYFHCSQRISFLYEFSTFKFIENYSVTQHIVYVLWTFHPCLKRLYRAMVDAVLYKFNLVKLFAGVWQFFYIFSCFLHYWGRCVKISYCLWIFCFLHILYTMCFKDLFWLHLDCCIFLMNWSFTIMN